MMLRKFGHTLFVSALMLAGACFTACNDSVIGDNTDGEPVQMFASIASRNAVESRVALGDIIHWGKNEFIKNDKINVDAWHFRDLDGVRKTETRFFDSQEMTYDGSSWVYTPVKYWPNVVDEKLAVCAYVMNATTSEKHCEINKNSETGYSMTFTDCALLDDVVVAPLTEVEQGETVNLYFYHIMSQIKVRARYVLADAGDSEDNYITFAGVTLVGASISGTFTGFSKDNEGNYVANWENVVYDGRLIADTTPYKINANEGFTDLYGMEFYQIPYESPVYNNKGEAHYSFFDVFVTFSGEDPNDYPEESDAAGHKYKAIKYNQSVAYKHQPGKTTTFDITINGKDIVVDVSVDGDPDWSGAGTGTGEDLVVDF